MVDKSKETPVGGCGDCNNAAFRLWWHNIQSVTGTDLHMQQINLYLLCIPGRSNCTGLCIQPIYLYSSLCKRRDVHTQRNWLYWVVQYLTRYVCHHAHPEELTLLDCTVCDTLHVLSCTPSRTDCTVLYCTVCDTLRVSSCTSSRSDCTGVHSISQAACVNMHTQHGYLY
jgi:hypothetical protein